MGTTYQPGVAPAAQPQESPPKNSTLKACHIANTKDDFHCKATETGQLSMGDRLRRHKQSLIDIRSTVGKKMCLVLFAGSCHAAGYKPAAQPGNGRTWFRRTDREQVLVHNVHFINGWLVTVPPT